MRILATLAIAGCLLQPGYTQDLTVNVVPTDAVTTIETITKTCTAVEGVSIGCAEQSVTSDPTAVPISLIKVTVPDGVRLRLKSGTTTINSLGGNVYSITTPGTHLVDVLAIGIIDGKLFFDEATVTALVESGNAPNPPPDPPGPIDPTVGNVYGCGLPAYQASRKYTPTERALIAKAYADAAQFLYGTPSMKYLTQTDDPNNTNPDVSVFAWLLSQVPDEFYGAMRQPIIDGQKVYCVDGTCSQQFLKTDWFKLLNEIAAGTNQ